MFKERLFKDRATSLDVRGHSRLMKGGESTFSGFDTSMEVKCPGCADLKYFQIMCNANECLVIVPGTGDLP